MRMKMEVMMVGTKKATTVFCPATMAAISGTGCLLRVTHGFVRFHLDSDIIFGLASVLSTTSLRFELWYRFGSVKAGQRLGSTGQTWCGLGSGQRVRVRRLTRSDGLVRLTRSNRVNSVKTGQLDESTRSTQPVNPVDSVNSVNAGQLGSTVNLVSRSKPINTRHGKV
uniref:Uncharacterized protein n=1 Tax=Helianthus annuus TaxID=4232 RepID=A0A251SPN4_HELAN